jgi:hypothetical protein
MLQSNKSTLRVRQNRPPPVRAGGGYGNLQLPSHKDDVSMQSFYKIIAKQVGIDNRQVKFNGNEPYKFITQTVSVDFLVCRWEIFYIKGQQCLAIDIEGINEASSRGASLARSYDKRNRRTYVTHLEYALENGTLQTRVGRQVVALPLNLWDVEQHDGRIIPARTFQPGDDA